MGALFKIFKSDGITEITNIKSVVYREAVNTGEHLRPGCVCSASVGVEVFNTQANAVSAGDVIYAYVYDNANNGTLLGKFNCEPKIDTKNSYKFEAYDNALKLNADFSQWLQANQSSFPMTVNQLVQQACTIAGVTLGTGTWPLSMQNVQAFYADGLTCRDILSYAAELSGKFVRCHTDGNVYIEWYTYNANSIAPSSGTGIYAYKQDGLTYANYTTTKLARVAVHPSGEDDVAYVYPTDRPSGNTLHIKNNLLLTGADASFYNAAAQQVYFAIQPISQYSPMSVNLFPRENPFRAGEIVSITDAQGVTISAPIMGMTISNAAATLNSEGRENYEDTTEIAKAITQLASDIVRINKLKVSWAEIDQAIVNYLTANDVIAQNLTIVDANDVVLATFNANGITLGQTGDFRAEIDSSSLQLIDKDGNVYALLGDARDANGESTVQYIEYDPSASAIKTFTLPGAISIDSVTINGNTVSSSNYSLNGDALTVSGVMITGEIIIVYKSSNLAPYFTFGSRDPNKYIGTPSTVAGSNCAAESQGSFATGTSNDAHGGASAVLGGVSNTANGVSSGILGGTNNEANGYKSVVLGGSGLIAKFANQLVFGTFNVADPNASPFPTDKGNYVEIVGCGSSTSSRANARTLDWSGNEHIRGRIQAGGEISTTDNIYASLSIGAGNNLSAALDLTVGRDATVGGTATITGGVVSDSYYTRKLPVPSANSTYLLARLEDSNGDGRGGVGFVTNNNYGEGTRLYHTRNGVANGLALYVDSNGNPYVSLGQPTAWRNALGIVSDFKAGDTISFPTSSTDNSYFTRFHGDWRDTKNLCFLIPTAKSCVGLSVTLAGTIYLVTNGVRNSVSMSSVTPTCFCTESGIAVRLTWSTAPSYAVQYNLASVQPYGFTVTFS